MAVLPVVVVAGLTAAARKWAPRWDTRGLASRWPAEITAAAAATAGLVVSAVLTSRYGAAPAAAAAAATWLAVVAVSIDLGSRRVPVEACRAVMVVGIALGGVFASDSGGVTAAIALATVVAAPAALGRVLRRDGHDALGRGDVRLLAAWTCCLSWWLGVHPLLIGLLLACLVAGAARLLARAMGRRHRWQAFAPALSLGLLLSCTDAAMHAATPCMLTALAPPAPHDCLTPWWSSGSATPVTEPSR